MCKFFISYEDTLHLGVCELAKYVRSWVVFWNNFHSWQKFYTAAGREKFQVSILVLSFESELAKYNFFSSSLKRKQLKQQAGYNQSTCKSRNRYFEIWPLRKFKECGLCPIFLQVLAKHSDFFKYCMSVNFWKFTLRNTRKNKGRSNNLKNQHYFINIAHIAFTFSETWIKSRDAQW